MNNLTITLTKQEALFIMEALEHEKARMAEKAGRTTNEDVQFDFRNDAAHLEGLITRLKESSGQMWENIEQIIDYPRGMSLGTVVDKAYHFAKQKHKDHRDDDGQLYFDAHLLYVFSILAQVTSDEDVLAAGLLHDVIEDTDATYEELEEKFGKRIADLVHEVTQEGGPDNYGYYFPRLKTKEGILIKFADRLSNLTRIDNWPPPRREQYLKRSKFWKSEPPPHKA
jgi:(p)ppGpp synthase/HD superfamily hydrolase